MNIPENPSIGYIAIILFLIGLFLFISGLNIIKVEKITVSKGFKTWIIGLILMVAGILTGIPELTKNIKESINIKEKTSIKEKIYTENEDNNISSETSIIFPSNLDRSKEEINNERLKNMIRNFSGGNSTMKQFKFFIGILRNDKLNYGIGYRDINVAKNELELIKENNLITYKPVGDKLLIERLHSGLEFYNLSIKILIKTLRNKKIFENIPREELVFFIHFSPRSTISLISNKEIENLIKKGVIESTGYSEKHNTTQYKMTQLGVKKYNEMLNTIKNKLNLR